MSRVHEQRIVGVDETGRGSCYGPLVTCAVSFPSGGLSAELLAQLGDSKSLSALKRQRAYRGLLGVVDYSFGAASAAEVDRLNPLQATMLAMQRAVLRLQPGPGAWVIVDGNKMPVIPYPGEAIVRADSLIAEVMAASILAKEFRDALVTRLAKRTPGYGLEQHAGYGTRLHFRAVRSLGASRHHRMTFLRKALQPQLVD